MISFHWLLHISWAHICLNPRPLYFFCLNCSLPCLLQGFKHLLLRVTPTTLFKVAAFFPDTWLSILCFVFSSGKGLLFYPLWLIQHLGPCLALRILNEWEQSHWRTEGLLIDEGSEGSTWKDRYKKKKLHFSKHTKNVSYLCPALFFDLFFFHYFWYSHHPILPLSSFTTTFALFPLRMFFNLNLTRKLKTKEDISP